MKSLKGADATNKVDRASIEKKNLNQWKK